MLVIALMGAPALLALRGARSLRQTLWRAALIGMALAAQPGTPIRRLILNDVGPRIGLAALRRIGEGAAMIRTKGEAGSGNIVEAVRHIRTIVKEMKQLTVLGKEENQ